MKRGPTPSGADNTSHKKRKVDDPSQALLTAIQTYINRALPLKRIYQNELHAYLSDVDCMFLLDPQEDERPQNELTLSFFTDHPDASEEIKAQYNSVIINGVFGNLLKNDPAENFVAKILANKTENGFYLLSCLLNNRSCARLFFEKLLSLDIDDQIALLRWEAKDGPLKGRTVLWTVASCLNGSNDLVIEYLPRLFEACKGRLCREDFSVKAVSIDALLSRTVLTFIVDKLWLMPHDFFEKVMQSLHRPLDIADFLTDPKTPEAVSTGYDQMDGIAPLWRLVISVRNIKSKKAREAQSYGQAEGEFREKRDALLKTYETILNTLLCQMPGQIDAARLAEKSCDEYQTNAQFMQNWGLENELNMLQQRIAFSSGLKAFSEGRKSLEEIIVMAVAVTAIGYSPAFYELSVIMEELKSCDSDLNTVCQMIPKDSPFYVKKISERQQRHYYLATESEDLTDKVNHLRQSLALALSLPETERFEAIGLIAFTYISAHVPSFDYGAYNDMDLRVELPSIGTADDYFTFFKLTIDKIKLQAQLAEKEKDNEALRESVRQLTQTVHTQGTRLAHLEATLSTNHNELLAKLQAMISTPQQALHFAHGQTPLNDNADPQVAHHPADADNASSKSNTP